MFVSGSGQLFVTCAYQEKVRTNIEERRNGQIFVAHLPNREAKTVHAPEPLNAFGHHSSRLRYCWTAERQE